MFDSGKRTVCRFVLQQLNRGVILDIGILPESSQMLLLGGTAGWYEVSVKGGS